VRTAIPIAWLAFWIYWLASALDTKSGSRSRRARLPGLTIAVVLVLGPYRFVRHPIYSGILLGLLGTALAVDVYFLIAVAIIGVYFVYSARVEEGLLSDVFPSAYPSYRARTKMLIPFVL
jgi:protein-S-isoprenylcysteine O-methyltransferase Ste14